MANIRKSLPISALTLLVIHSSLGNPNSYPPSLIGTSCNNTETCRVLIGGSVECYRPRPYPYPRKESGSCLCLPYHIPLRQLGLGREECLPIAVNGPGSPCKHDEQCVAGLGLLSSCLKNQYPFQCQCFDPNNKAGVRYSKLEKRCVYQKKFGDPCESGWECWEALGEGVADCVDFVCKRIRNGGSKSGLSWIAIFALAANICCSF